MAAAAMLDLEVREVTDDEVAFFVENGWVKLPRLINRDQALELLDIAKQLLGEDGSGPNESPPSDHGFRWYRSYGRVRETQPRFEELATATQLGRNIARLFGRDSSIRLTKDSLMAKMPSAKGLGDPTLFHQDTTQNFFSEANTLNIWVALDEVTADQGALEFYSGSQKLGNLGDLLNPEILEAWQPYIAEHCTPSGPVEMQPGDATAHAHFTIHGTGKNLSDRTRWSWAALYLPGDARYTGAKSPFTDGLGLTPFGPMDHPGFPIIYPGAGRP